MKQSWILLLFAVILTTSCLSVKSSGSRGAKKLFASYYSGAGSTQYFIKPLEFDSPKQDFTLLADFTFRYKDNLDSLVTVNYNLKGNQLINQVEALYLISGKDTIRMEDHLRLFKDKMRKDLATRYSSSMSLRELKAAMSNSEWRWLLETTEMSIQFACPTKTGKKIRSLEKNLFVLID